MNRFAIFLLIFSSLAWSKETNQQSKDQFIAPGKHKIEFYYEGVKYVGVLNAFQNGDGSWTVSGEPGPNSKDNEIRVLGTMNQLLDPNVINEFYFSGSIFINGAKLYQAILQSGDMILVKKRGENYFQSDQNKCKKQEANRPLSDCIFIEKGSFFRFYP